MPSVYRSSEFFRALPARLKPHLPRDLRRFEQRVRNWMVQVHYGDFSAHYEASAYTRLNAFEIGLHFERRGRELNDALMQHFTPHVFEIKALLGEGVHFERWDKGWSKIYETVPLAPYDEAYLEQIAVRMAALIACLQPILSEAE
jgi:hypothetical protein